MVIQNRWHVKKPRKFRGFLRFIGQKKCFQNHRWHRAFLRGWQDSNARVMILRVKIKGEKANLRKISQIRLFCFPERRWCDWIDKKHIDKGKKGGRNAKATGTEILLSPYRPQRAGLWWGVRLWWGISGNLTICFKWNLLSTRRSCLVRQGEGDR